MSGPATAAEGPLQHLSPARDASGLSWAAKYVLLLLITYMGPRGIFPSQQTIATAAGLSKRKVWSALTELQGHGVVHADRGGRTKTSSYEIDLATLRSMSAPDVAGGVAVGRGVVARGSTAIGGAHCRGSSRRGAAACGGRLCRRTLAGELRAARADGRIANGAAPMGSDAACPGRWRRD